MIKDIYKVSFMKNKWAFVGTLRNEKKFNLHDTVFIQYGEKIIRCKIVGVELPPKQNPDYIYKVEIPEEIISEEILYQVPSEDRLKRISLTCECIFSTVEEAKASARKNLDRMYELQDEEIERYFEQFI